MRVWYVVLALANLLAGGFLVAATYGFDSSTAVNLGFAISMAVLVLGCVMGYVGYTHKDKNVRISLGLFGLLTAGLAGWTIVATQVFDDDTARWLVFGSGLGHIALSVAGIITQEATAD